MWGYWCFTYAAMLQTQTYRPTLLDFWNIDPEIGIGKIAGCKNKDIFQKLGRYLIK
jgi:hypothetical protein